VADKRGRKSKPWNKIQTQEIGINKVQKIRNKTIHNSVYKPPACRQAGCW
jgi:hypothetical protein